MEDSGRSIKLHLHVHLKYDWLFTLISCKDGYFDQEVQIIFHSQTHYLYNTNALHTFYHHCQKT